MNKYAIIKANNNNKEDILAILKGNLDKYSEEIYIWKYNNCPYGVAHCWLAQEEATKAFVGSCSLFPRKLFIQGKRIDVGIAGDFAVEKEHRAYGPAIKLQKTMLSSFNENGFRFIYGVPNKLSEALLLKVGYKEIGQFKRFVKVIKTEYKTSRYLLLKYMTKAFSKIINYVLELNSRENRYKKALNYKIEMNFSFDQRFDTLFEKALKIQNIIGERSSIFLNWRYVNSPLHEYKIFTITSEDKSVLGYMVYYIEDNRCHIQDLLCHDSREILDALLAEFLLYLRRDKIGSVSICFLGNDHYENKLKEYNFFVRNKNTKVLIYSNSSDLNRILLQSNNWYFLENDNDV